MEVYGFHLNAYESYIEPEQNINGMNEFPNYPTPSTASEGSLSPGSFMSLGISQSQPDSGANTVYHNMMVSNTSQPYLNILVQPVDKFRFRYKSEMSGTHGCLMGQSPQKSKKNVYPAVQLKNYSGDAIIRCSLYQSDRTVPEVSWQPHPHRLVLKDSNEEETTDPHHITVGEFSGWTANFKNMGIIHTSMKHTKDELLMKLKTLKKEEIARKENVFRDLSLMEQSELEEQMHLIEKSIDKNRVCLRFDAFNKIDGILEPICPPVYSVPISNLKSVMTGDLKIARMDFCTSPVSGREIFLLVEKVARKNIQVRFFELDEDGFETWSAFGHFSDADVHRQYAIVVKTPPYKSLNIDSDKKVYIQLVRPSDGAVSEKKPFYYIPEPTKSKKRARCDSYSYNFNSGDLPQSFNTSELTSEEFNRYAKEVDSEEFKQLTTDLDIHYLDCDALDSPKAAPGQQSALPPAPNSSRPWLSANEAKAKEILNDFVNFLKTKPSKERTIKKMYEMFQYRKRECNDITNIFHECFMHNYDVKLPIYMVLEVVKKYQLFDLLNMRNRHGQGILHIAIANGKEMDQLNVLPLSNMDLMLKDIIPGQYPLHLAIIHNYGINDLLKTGKIKIDQINDEGRTSLQLAVEHGNLEAVKWLIAKGATVHIVDRRNGNTLLHEAIAHGHVPIIQYLMGFTNLDPEKENYDGLDAFDYLHKTLRGEAKKTVLKILDPDFDDNDTLKSEMFSDEEDDEDDVDETEIFESVEIKSEPMEDDDEDAEDHKVADLVRQLSAVIKGPKVVENLYKSLNFGYILQTDACKDEDPVVFLINLAMKNGTTIEDLKRTFKSLNLTEAVKCIDKYLPMTPS